MIKRKKTSKIVKILSILFLVTHFVSNSQNIDSLLVVLEETMSKRNEYDLLKEARINNLKKLLEDSTTTLENRYYIINNLINENEYYSFNSTLLFIEKNIELAKKIDNDYFIKESILRLAKLLATSGRYDESIELLSQISSSDLSQKLIYEYFFIHKRCYYELRAISQTNILNKKYDKLYIAYKDSLNVQISNLDKDSITYLKVVAQNYRDANDSRNALKVNAKILAIAMKGTRDYALAAFNRSYMSYELERDRNIQKKYLILSAIADIQSSTKDNASLVNLAEILYNEEDIEKAHKYINFSLEDAKFYNSKLRSLNISNISPEISNSFEVKIQKQSNKLEKQVLFISVLLLILLVALLFIFNQYKKIKTARRNLKSANSQLKDLNNELSLTNQDLKRLYEELSNSDKIKEQYIGTFLNLYSDYINKLDTYRKMVRTYIVSNRTNSLLELTKSKQVIENELNIFYENFDKSFLHIYPDFVEEFNKLLQEDKRIIINKGENLNTELRIFALIRLGITNSSKISKILRYSVNTIYNYRAQVKNNAKDRNDFENLVKKIS